jgi:hypothetical protein
LEGEYRYNRSVIGALCIASLLLSGQERTDRLTALYYDSSRGILAWGEHTMRPDAGSSGGLCCFFVSNRGTVTATEVPFFISIIVDETQFVTHHDFSGLVDVKTGTQRAISRFSEASASEGDVYYGGSDWHNEDHRRGAIHRIAVGSGEKLEWVVRDIEPDPGASMIEIAAGSRRTGVVAWAWRTNASECPRLSWSRDGVTRVYDHAVQSAVVSPYGPVFVIEAGDRPRLVAIDTASGKVLFERAVEKWSQIAADQAAASVLVVGPTTPRKAVVFDSVGTQLRTIEMR